MVVIPAGGKGLQGKDGAWSQFLSVGKVFKVKMVVWLQFPKAVGPFKIKLAACRPKANKAINHRHFVAGQPKARLAHGCRLWLR